MWLRKTDLDPSDVDRCGLWCRVQVWNTRTSCGGVPQHSDRARDGKRPMGGTQLAWGSRLSEARRKDGTGTERSGRVFRRERGICLHRFESSAKEVRPKNRARRRRRPRPRVQVPETELADISPDRWLAEQPLGRCRSGYALRQLKGA